MTENKIKEIAQKTLQKAYTTFDPTLFNQLMSLCETFEGIFQYKDATHIDGGTYRVFFYRLASYGNFQQPGALSARGILFEVDSAGIPLRLAAYTPDKFFNINENPFTMNIDYSKVVEIMDKADGSLISTFLGRDGELYLKSKTSLTSLHVKRACQILGTDFIELLEELYILAAQGYTVNMELVSSEQGLQIVLSYDTPHLKILSARNIFTGDYLEGYRLPNDYHELRKYWIMTFMVSSFVQPDEIKDKDYTPEELDRQITLATTNFMNRIPSMQNIEGFVIKLTTGQLIKIKTDWYAYRHNLKFSIQSPRLLYEAIITEKSDDIKSFFSHDAYVMERVLYMETLIQQLYLDTIVAGENFHRDNNLLSKKDYAIKGQLELSRNPFVIAMKLYDKKEYSQTEYLIGLWDKSSVRRTFEGKYCSELED